MNYVKKMCILRQARQGFSGDGKTLSGLIKAEQYGKNLAVEVSVINFAPLVSGEYYCLLADEKGNTELLPLRGKSIFNILSDMDISGGFCGVICYVKNEIVPVAYGVNGNHSYDWRKLVRSALPTEQTETARQDEPQATVYGLSEEVSTSYDDETVATVNYYKENVDNERELLQEVGGNARTQSESENEGEKTGLDASENVHADDIRHAFETDGQGYYLAVKDEIDRLFKTYPKDDTLIGAFSCSEWVRIKGESASPEYLVGVVYDDGKAKYVCYALAAENKNEPPEELRDSCSFVPTSPYDDEKGFFVIFQSATTGECIKPVKL